MKKLTILMIFVFMFVSLGLVNTMEVNAQSAVFAGGWPYSAPPSGHFNMFVPGAIELRFFRDIHQLPMGFLIWADNEYEGYLASDWTIDQENNQITVQLREDVYWHNGDEFNAEDVITTFTILRFMEAPVWNYLSSVDVISDHELTFNIDRASSLILRMVLRENIVDTHTYGDFAARIEQLIEDGHDSESEEWKDLQVDFSEFRPDYVNATGPYYLDPASVSSSQVVLKKNNNSYLADQVHFDEILVYNGGVSDLTPLVLNQQADYLTHEFPSGTMTAFENMGIEFVQTPAVDGLAVYFNHNLEPLNDLNVRKALAYAIDRNLVGDIALPGVSIGVDWITGIGEPTMEGWNVETGSLTRYELDHDKAASYLEESGFYKEDGNWYSVDGDQFTLRIQTPSAWADASVAAETIAELLTDFGIETRFNGIEESQRVPNIEAGNFEMALSFWGTGQPHPMYAYEGPIIYQNTRASGPGIGFDVEVETDRGTFNMEDLILSSADGWDVQDQEETIQDIVYSFNQSLPILPVIALSGRNLTSSGLTTEWPDFDDPIYLNSPGDDNFTIISILRGDIKPIQ
ncbi:hypothetical protein I0Q91_03145 [Halanaerobiaceae bacterium Z-7014]|uniref:Solute-binding protein family 5 domain-containing protein n=1 Tax=Halonatronomonas betaini TaxID=2778430 RepID=A0A931F815_9FIRM|nr:ABC transporter substrate-binding protein [Halonatronomonas betaini]MBF8436063.1 hypothetical protein [Halonatronomonas betaini]